ncbi:MAG: tetratricopeptide repeat protein [Candidatus Omnitrophica bacterium]|nr:tetratricopeptide repeat protein [Candidatus Omnitrophota bacterium]
MNRLLGIPLCLAVMLLGRISIVNADDNLLARAMAAYAAQDYTSALELTDELLTRQNGAAAKQQQSLIVANDESPPPWISDEFPAVETFKIPVARAAGRITSIGYSESNQVAAALFLQAQTEHKLGNIEKSNKRYQEIIDNLPAAYQRGYQGWFWNIAFMARESLNNAEEKYDFHGYEAGKLISQAWKSLHKRDFSAAKTYAQKALLLYDETTSRYRKDMAVAHYIIGMLHRLEKNLNAAKASFRRVVDDYPQTTYPDIKDYPYYNDITGRARDQLELMKTDYDFGNYTSETLTVKAWKSWDRQDYRGIQLFAEKCIELWGAKARKMQEQMDSFAPPGYIPYFWAVNDVGTCHFILAMMYEKQGDLAKAKEFYEIVIREYNYAQCWDPRGHYWKVAEVGKEKLAELVQHATGK